MSEPIPCPHCTYECKRPQFSEAIVCPACEWLFFWAEQHDGTVVAWKAHQTQPKPRVKA